MALGVVAVGVGVVLLVTRDKDDDSYYDPTYDYGTTLGTGSDGSVTQPTDAALDPGAGLAAALPGPESFGAGWEVAASPQDQSQTGGAFPVTCDFDDPLSTTFSEVERAEQSYLNGTSGQGIYVVVARLGPGQAASLVEASVRDIDDCEKRAEAGGEMLVRTIEAADLPAGTAGADAALVGRSLLGEGTEADDTWFVLRRAGDVAVYGLVYSPSGAEPVDTDDLEVLGEVLDIVVAAVS